MDQYTILGRIGEGAHGIVFKAKHIESGEIVALKKVYTTVYCLMETCSVTLILLMI
jgi:serine/threonine protein kinase